MSRLIKLITINSTIQFRISKNAQIFINFVKCNTCRIDFILETSYILRSCHFDTLKHQKVNTCFSRKHHWTFIFNLKVAT